MRTHTAENGCGYSKALLVRVEVIVTAQLYYVNINRLCHRADGVDSYEDHAQILLHFRNEKVVSPFDGDCLRNAFDSMRCGNKA